MSLEINYAKKWSNIDIELNELKKKMKELNEKKKRNIKSIN